MMVVAHRGSSGSAPENTMAAFRAAAAAGADMIELDVRFSAECVCVVIHDRTLRRTTNGRGRVHAQTLAHLRSLDAGSWFSRRHSGEHIPTLAEVLRELPVSIGLDIEVKTDGDRRSLHLRASALARTIDQHGGHRQIIVSSFDHRFLTILARHAPNLAIGILVQPLRDITRRPSRIARRAGAIAVFCSRRIIRHRMVDDAHLHGISIGVYCVDTPAQLAKLQRYGVDMIFTNHPETILPCLG